MKFTFAAAALTLAAGVAAQSLTDLPECALPCLAGGLSATGCGLDIACACKKEEFVSGAVTCVKGKCTSEADVAEAVKVSVGICKKAGVDVVIPGTEEPVEEPVESTTTTAAPESTTTAAPETTTTTAPETTTVPVVPEETVAPVKNGTNGTAPVVPPTNEDSAAGKIAASGILAAGLGLAVAFGL